VIFVKINTIKAIIYGAFIIGAFTMISAVPIPALSDHITTLMYIGGMIVVCGMIFSIFCLIHPTCIKCQKFVKFRGLSAKKCPLCGDE